MAGRWEHRHRWSLDLTRTRHGWVLNGSCTRCGEHLAVPVPARLLTRARAPHDRRHLMKTLAAWFTPERRQSIQLFFGALAPLAILAGFGNDGIWQQILIVTGAVLQFVSSLLSLLNVRDPNTVWAIIRGAIYALAATVSPALVLLGFYDEATNATVLLAFSLGLGALSNLLAIFIGKQQKIETLTRQVVALREGADGTHRLDQHID